MEKNKDMRSKKIALVAHCHLNVNTKIAGYADYPGARMSLITDLLKEDVGIIQLPCPEIAHAGMKRWGCCYEQYDTVGYRKTVREILAPIITTLIELERDGVECVGIYGVDGSPSCGVNRTCFGYAGGAFESLEQLPTVQIADGPGVFIEELQAALEEAHITCKFIGIEERA